MIKLSQRLELIAKQISPGSRLADIGSDHALLPAYLAQQGIVSFAVAGEVNEGPRNAAQKQVEQATLTNTIAVRLGDGLDVISPGEVDVITIAGMGGTLIAQILSRGIDKLHGVRKLILQPNVGEDVVRKWLVHHEWVLLNEIILEEDGKIYEILVAQRISDAAKHNERLYRNVTLSCGVELSKEYLFLMGPYLTRQPSDVFFVKWESELHKLEYIYSKIIQSGQESSQTKAAQFAQKIKEIREVLDCLQKDKR